MARQSSPRYYPSRSAWFTCIQGRQIRLATGLKEPTRKAAMAEFQRLMFEMSLNDGALPSDLRLAVVADLLLQEVKQNRSELTFQWYRRHLQSFVDHYPTMDVGDVRPLHVTRWVSAHSWSPTTQHGAITAIKRLFSWSKKQGLIKANHLADLEKPTPNRRESIPDQAGFQTILSGSARSFKLQRPNSQQTGKEFQDFLTVLRETGMRPSEAMALEARWIDLDARIIRMPSKTTRKTGRLREVHLTDQVVNLLRTLSQKHPEGPVLRNSRGRPWTRNATACRFARMREKHGLGSDATAESFRHGFATDALVAGVELSAVATLMGHTDVTMVSRVYSKLHDQKEFLKSALNKVRPGENS